jgi:hypothetical protein
MYVALGRLDAPTNQAAFAQTDSEESLMSAHMAVHKRLLGLLAAAVLAAAATAGVLAATATAVSTVASGAFSERGSVQARSATATASAQAGATPVGGQALGGFTSQGWPVVIEMSPNGKRIALVATGLEMRCTSGVRVPLEDAWFRLPIRPNGKVAGAITIRPSKLITGGSDSFSGMFNRRRSTFSGVWELDLKLVSSGGQTGQCDSGRVAFNARL